MDEDVCMEVNSGACQFKTIIKGSLTEDGKVKLLIESGCPMVSKLGSSVEEWDVFDCVASPLSENPVTKAAGKVLKHPACPVPIAMIKAIESAAGMAVKKDVTMCYLPSSP